MGLFGKGKTMVEKAEDQRAKNEMKRLKLQDKIYDTAMVKAEQEKRAAHDRRLVA